MKKTLTILFAIASIYTKANDEKLIVKSDLKQATVYKVGAELTHTATANLKNGSNELIIDNIANAIDINSIQVKTSSLVTLMSVEFANNYLAPTTKSPRVKMLEDSFNVLHSSWEKLSESLASNNELYEVLRANRDLKGTQAGLNVAEVIKLMDYYKTKLSDLQETKQSLNEKMKKIDEHKSKIQAQISEESSKNISITGRLVLQLTAAKADKYDFTVSYVTNNAFWSPFYDVRLEDIKSPMKIVTKAKISQTTGIDWKQVKLSLSTSTPNQLGAAPVLSAWYLAYINPVQYMNARMNSISQNSIQSYSYKTEASQDLSEVVTIKGKGTQLQTEPIYIVNGEPMSKEEFAKISPNAIAKMEVLKDAAATNLYGAQASAGAIVITLKDGLEDYISVAENTLNISFDIDLPYDVPTNGKPQTAILSTQEVAATYKHYAVPKLDRDAYLLAEISDWGKLNLLPGEANIIFEGTYVGKSFIDPSSTNDTLNLTLGRDKRIVIKRDKLIDYSSVKFLGTDKLQKFTYQLTVKNTKKEAVSLLLKDQFPLTTNKEIAVELIDDGGAEVNTDLGVLNWKLKLAPGETRKIKFSYSIKYPKDKTVNVQ